MKRLLYKLLHRMDYSPTLAMIVVMSIPILAGVAAILIASALGEISLWLGK